jgi:tripartite-type tricarboxylate transporter receptor subunit TctC
MGMMGPAKLSGETVGKLNGELDTLIKELAVIERIHKLGSEPSGGSPADFRNRIAADIDRWNKVIGDAHIERI